MDNSMVSSLLDILNSTRFKLNALMKNLKNLDDWKQTAHCEMKRSIVENGSEKSEAKVRGARHSTKKGIRNKYYRRNSKAIAISLNERRSNISSSWRVEERAVKNQCMNKAFSKSCTNLFNRKSWAAETQNCFWIENCQDLDRQKLFLALVQVFYDRTVTPFKSTGLVAHLVHVVLMNGSLSYRRWLVENELYHLGFIPVIMKRCKGNKKSREVGQK